MRSEFVRVGFIVCSLTTALAVTTVTKTVGLLVRARLTVKAVEKKKEEL